MQLPFYRIYKSSLRARFMPRIIGGAADGLKQNTSSFVYIEVVCVEGGVRYGVCTGQKNALPYLMLVR